MEVAGSGLSFLSTINRSRFRSSTAFPSASLSIIYFRYFSCFNILWNYLQHGDPSTSLLSTHTQCTAQCVLFSSAWGWVGLAALWFGWWPFRGASGCNGSENWCNLCAVLWNGHRKWNAIGEEKKKGKNNPNKIHRQLVLYQFSSQMSGETYILEVLLPEMAKYSAWWLSLACSALRAAIITTLFLFVFNLFAGEEKILFRILMGKCIMPKCKPKKSGVFLISPWPGWPLVGQNTAGICCRRDTKPFSGGSEKHRHGFIHLSWKPGYHQLWDQLWALCRDAFILKKDKKKCWHWLTGKVVATPTPAVRAAEFGLFLKDLLQQKSLGKVPQPL